MTLLYDVIILRRTSLNIFGAKCFLAPKCMILAEIGKFKTFFDDICYK